MFATAFAPCDFDSRRGLPRIGLLCALTRSTGRVGLHLMVRPELRSVPGSTELPAVIPQFTCLGLFMGSRLSRELLRLVKLSSSPESLARVPASSFASPARTMASQTAPAQISRTPSIEDDKTKTEGVVAELPSLDKVDERTPAQTPEDQFLKPREMCALFVCDAQTDHAGRSVREVWTGKAELSQSSRQCFSSPSWSRSSAFAAS